MFLSPGTYWPHKNAEGLLPTILYRKWVLVSYVYWSF